KDYPNMNIIETKGDQEALQYVNSGKAYFTIATLPVASHVISKYMLNDLHIAGYTGMVYNLSMAVRDDDKILLNILDKTLENLSKEESKQIMRKWVTSSVKESVADYSLIWKILIIVFIIILFLAYRHYILKKSNIELQIKVKEKTQDLQKLNKNLEIKINEEVNENLKTQKRLFKSEKMASMGEMIGNIAHQWRQPLSVISTGSTGMKMQKKIGTLSDEELFKTCDIINDNAQYLSKTIDDFRNFIIGDRTKTIFILKDDINSFLNLVDGSIKSNNINMILDLRDDIKIDGYANELIQCLINIFNNAKDILIEKAEEDRLIFISTFIVEDKAVIKIKDNGGGIPKDIINKIFEPYFTTKHKSQGTGLGLHMAYKLIVDGMGGTIEINNVEYEYNDNKHTGAEFTILLPMS
ncbi:MAG: histidine kinase, partial [Epsilonproteobacteria bacterium]